LRQLQRLGERYTSDFGERQPLGESQRLGSVQRLGIVQCLGSVHHHGSVQRPESVHHIGSVQPWKVSPLGALVKTGQYWGSVGKPGRLGNTWQDSDSLGHTWARGEGGRGEGGGLSIKNAIKDEFTQPPPLKKYGAHEGKTWQDMARHSETRLD
jgi:hypothetical protein